MDEVIPFIKEKPNLSIEYIEKHIEKVWKEIIELRQKFNEEFKDDKWRDRANDSGLLITAEALCCFFIPAYFSENLKQKLPQYLNKDIIEHSIKYLLDQSESGFYGDPYVDFYDTEGNRHEFIDAASYFITTYIYGSKLGVIPQKFNKTMQERSKKGLNLIIRSTAKFGGWSWGNYKPPEKPFLYTTWTALEALNDILDRDFIDLLEIDMDTQRLISRHISKTVAYIRDTHLNPDNKKDEQGGNQYLIEEVLNFPDTGSGIQYNLWALLSSIYSGHIKMGKKADIEDLKLAFIVGNNYVESNIKSWADEKKFFFDVIDGAIYDRKDEETREASALSDRTAIPLFLKSLAIFLREAQLQEEVAQYIENPENPKLSFKPILNQLNLLYLRLLDKEIHPERKAVWDKKAPKQDGYAIYYTERAIEALIAVYRCLNIKKSEAVEVQTNIPDFVLQFFDNCLADSPRFIEQKNKIIELKQKVDEIKALSESKTEEAVAVEELLEIVQKPNPIGDQLNEFDRLLQEWNKSKDVITLNQAIINLLILEKENSNDDSVKRYISKYETEIQNFQIRKNKDIEELNKLIEEKKYNEISIFKESLLKNYLNDKEIEELTVISKN